jgi:hypothetical protein
METFPITDDADENQSIWINHAAGHPLDVRPRLKNTPLPIPIVVLSSTFRLMEIGQSGNHAPLVLVLLYSIISPSA